MNIGWFGYAWPQRLIRLAVLAILAGAGIWFAEHAAEEFRVTCGRAGSRPDCVAISARWGLSRRTELPAGALQAATVLTRTDIDRDGSVTTYRYLALDTAAGRIVSAQQDEAAGAAAEIAAFLADPSRRDLDVRLSNRLVFRLVAALWSLLLVYLLILH
jgi:hypothetical protein